jgi:hypothetical protein
LKEGVEAAEPGSELYLEGYFDEDGRLLLYDSRGEHQEFCAVIQRESFLTLAHILMNEHMDPGNYDDFNLRGHVAPMTEEGFL